MVPLLFKIVYYTQSPNDILAPLNMKEIPKATNVQEGDLTDRQLKGNLKPVSAHHSVQH